MTKKFEGLRKIVCFLTGVRDSPEGIEYIALPLKLFLYGKMFREKGSLLMSFFSKVFSIVNLAYTVFFILSCGYSQW